MTWPRNVYVVDGRTQQEISGFFQYGSVTTQTFYQWLQEVFTANRPYRLFPCLSKDNLQPTGDGLAPDSAHAIAPGVYVLLDENANDLVVSMVLDMPRRREYSFNDTHTPQTANFTSRVRARDRRCCITGLPVWGDNWVGFESAHIWPVSQSDSFYSRGMGGLITDTQSQSDKINSVQNGFLCTSTMHKYFDDYQIGINPDDGYKITDFVGRDRELSPNGRIFAIDPTLPEQLRPSDVLLRDHFRQCVLACLKAASGPKNLRPFDPDIDLGPGGFDLARGWWTTEEGSKQLEVELAARLHRHTLVQPL